MDAQNNTDARITLSLSGSDWQLARFEPGEGVSREAYAEGFPRDRAIPACVPGDVHADLQASGELPDLYVGLNSRQAHWVPQKEWWYRKTFRPGRSWPERRVRLEFDGVDYACAVWLNGRFLGEHEGQFTPFGFDVTDALRPEDENVLVVRIEPAPENVLEALFHQTGQGPSHQQAHDILTRTLRRWKSRTVTGWDWGTPIWSMGLWQDVRLIATRGAHLSDLTVIPTLHSSFARADLSICFQAMCAAPRQAKISARVWCLTADATVAQAEWDVSLDAGSTKQTLSMSVDHPHLWWPAGCGEQNRYQMTVRLSDPLTGEGLEELSETFGIRELRMLPNPPSSLSDQYRDYRPKDDWDYAPGTVRTLEKDHRGTFLVRINDRRVFLRGANWIPCDLRYGVVNERRYEHLLRQAANANINALRVWGGGLIEKQAFYDLCDRLGLLVLQEMPHAGRRPLETDPALEEEAGQLRQVLPKLINHPSVIRYGFGNELYLHSETSRQVAQFETICREIDPSRPAYGPSPVTTDQRHGPHDFSFENGYATYNTVQPTTSGAADPAEWDEYGAAGASCLKTLKRILPTESLWPIRPDDAYWTWHKAMHAYGEDRWLSQKNYQRLFGESEDLATEVRCSQFAQAEGLRYANQAHRRAAWHRSGCFFWTFNEPWPNAAHGCIVEYDGRPKMAYYFVQRSYRRIDVSARYDAITCPRGQRLAAEFWVVNDSPNALEHTTLSAEYLDLRGQTLGRQDVAVTIPPHQPTRVTASDFVVPESLLGEVLWMRLTLRNARGEALAEHDYTFGVVDRDAKGQSIPPGALRGMLHAPQTELAVSLSPLRRHTDALGRLWAVVQVEIGNVGPAPAIFVDVNPILSESVSWSLSDNFFCLPAQERKQIFLSMPDGITRKPDLMVSAWNVPQRKMT